MKNILITLLVTSFFTACNNNTSNIETKSATPFGPYEVFFLIHENSELSKKILNKDGVFDEAKTYFMDTNGNKIKSYFSIAEERRYTYDFNTSKYHQFGVYAKKDLGGDNFFNGTEQIIYLVTKDDKMPIKITGIVPVDNIFGFDYEVTNVSFQKLENVTIKISRSNKSFIYLTK